MSSNTWACIASGPSLCKEDVDYCREKGWRLLSVNTSWELAPDSNIIYASDYRWWERYHEKVNRESTAELYTANHKAAAEFGLNRVQLIPGAGYSDRQGYIYTGSLSGFQAIQLAGQQGADRIILLGYDMKHAGGKTHWHGDHPLGWPNCPKLDNQIAGFSKLAEQSPVPIINATRDTALECFMKKELAQID